jgi:hypothetical protein
MKDSKNQPGRTEYWWDSHPEERFWMEITNREDIGADLKCPQFDETGKPQPSYDLIRAIWPGDIVFHYSTKSKAIVGAAIAGGPIEQRSIIWISHRVIGKPKNRERILRPGWWLPLYGFALANEPLKLAKIQDPEEESWVRGWIDQKRKSVSGPVAAPFQRYKHKLRAAQGYLSKMPADFVRRWTALSKMVNKLASLQDQMSRLGALYAPEHAKTFRFLKLKNEEDYVVRISAGVERRSRKHERLVRMAAEYLSKHCNGLVTPHPIDLRIIQPKNVIIEAKLTHDNNAVFAVREAVGQLYEYRYFLGPKDALLCILLDANPGPALVEYVENHLALAICWMVGKQLIGGPKTAVALSACGIANPDIS